MDAAHREHWLVSDGRWSVRLDLNGGTLLGGPILVEHRIAGTVSAKPKLKALRQFLVLAQMGALPASMLPRERKAVQSILELRASDALLDEATQVAFALLPPHFTLRALQDVHEAILGTPLNKPAFRRRMLNAGWIEGTGEREEGGAFRPAELLRIKP